MDILHAMMVRSRPEEIYQALTEQEGLSAWFAQRQFQMGRVHDGAARLCADWREADRGLDHDPTA
jgi:uncharacterized protein YndB with AHSA1/START domain